MSSVTAPASAPDPVRLVSADLQQVEGPLNTMFRRCVGAGRANEGLRADWRRQLALARRECGFEYIRMHGLFCDDMGVYREVDGRPEYNWRYVDELFDFLHEIGMTPFVELGFMPNALASGPRTIFWWKGNITPPKDLAKWADLVRAFVLHMRERHGDAALRTWYFEVWNEPNLEAFWSGTKEQYLELYASTARAIKEVSPVYKVGGPGTAGCGWVPEFLGFCRQNTVPVDFVTTHTYGVQAGHIDATGTAGTALCLNEDSIYGEVAMVRRQMAECGAAGLELHFTEWSSSYTPTDPFHDSYHSAAYIIEKLRKCGDAAQSMSYWTFTDIFEENGPRWEAFHGGFGLINYHDIKKPAYHAYRFLNRLGGTELRNADPASWVCTDEDGGVQALIWDFTNTFPAEDMINQVYYRRDLPARPKGAVSLRLTNLRAGDYQVEVFQVGYRVNDAYAAYRDLGAPAQLTREQVAKIKAESCGDARERFAVRIDPRQTFERRFDLRENDVLLVVLTPNG